MYIVYAIFNRKYKKFYIGQTKNIAGRIDLHNSGKFSGCYTSRFDGKWELIYSEEVVTCHEALKREKQLKSYRGREFIKNLV